jgi:hypothetical protein
MNSTRRLFALFPFLLGLALFVTLIHRIGATPIISYIGQIGWGLAVLALTCGTRYFLRTLAWYLSIERSSRRLSLFALFNLRLAGETLGELMFAGLVVGESIKAIAASRWLPGVSAYSSVFMENLLFGLSVVIFLASGVFVLFLSTLLPLPILVLSGISVVFLLACGVILFLVLHQGWQVLSPLLSYVEKKQFGWESLERQAPQIRSFEDAVHGFYRSHRSLFLGLMGLEFSTHFIGVFEAWWILYMIHCKGTWMAAFLVESANRLINSFFSIVPLRLGVDGGMALVLESIGYPTAVGVSLAIIRKVRLMVWMIPGLFLIGKYSVQPGDSKPR